RLLFLYRSVLFLCHPSAPTESYTLSLHDALPISAAHGGDGVLDVAGEVSHLGFPVVIPEAGSRKPEARSQKPQASSLKPWALAIDRKSTRLNSSHVKISYAVFCLKKKKKKV